jgi:hypothetical protein
MPDLNDHNELGLRAVRNYLWAAFRRTGEKPAGEVLSFLRDVAEDAAEQDYLMRLDRCVPPTRGLLNPVASVQRLTPRPHGRPLLDRMYGSVQEEAPLARFRS